MRDLRREASAYRRDEDGSMIIFSIFLLVLMLLAGGMAVDFMRHEMARTQLQTTLDRAVLAAADLQQTQDPETVVRDYFAAAGMTDFLETVDVNEGLNYREVSATTSATIPSTFLRLTGIYDLHAPAVGAAEERIANVEISMVLDISGSMGRTSSQGGSKISHLRTAANVFVDTVLNPETDGLISVSVVPYTAQVNAGPELFDRINVNQLHSYSHCVDFEEDDFYSAAFDLNKTYTQMQHFEWSSSSYRPIRNPGCPDENFERIVTLSQNESALSNRINQFQARANTAIHLGMKWGVTLLDPSFRPVINDMINDGDVESDFSGRPADYTDPETLKTVVLMTDGENVDTYRISNWAYDSNSDRAHWNRYTLWNYLYRIPSHQRSSFYYEKYSWQQADVMLSNICTAAKDEGIVVWTIGFEVGNHGANVMESCASSPAHFFRVEGVELTDAFHSIAKTINQLRLIQ